MSQKTVLITGATSGIGLAGAEELGRRGWRVLVHARNEARGKGALESLRAAVPKGDFEVVTGDLSSLKSIADLARQVAAKAPVLDALWNNAGGLQTERRASADGVEFQMAVNHLAPFALTSRLLPFLKAAPAARIVATSSGAQHFAFRGIKDWFSDRPGKYRPMRVYGQTKLANILFTQELTRRLAGTSVTAHAFHPGFVRTGFGSGGDPAKKSPFESLSFLAMPPAQGADTGVFLVDDPEPSKTPGLYWVKRKPKTPSGLATVEAGGRLWDQSEAVTGRVLGTA
jgi:NAD(P)-dependent dehydrogenase (short-subunit alcohol dehydrogenase family)